MGSAHIVSLVCGPEGSLCRFAPVAGLCSLFILIIVINIMTSVQVV